MHTYTHTHTYTYTHINKHLVIHIYIYTHRHTLKNEHTPGGHLHSLTFDVGSVTLTNLYSYLFISHNMQLKSVLITNMKDRWFRFDLKTDVCKLNLPVIFTRSMKLTSSYMKFSNS